MTQLIWPTAKDAIAHTPHVARAPLKWNPTDHLLSRLAFGPTPYHRTYVAKHGPDAWFHSQVRAAKTYAGYKGNTKVAAVGPLLPLSPYDVAQQLAAMGNDFGWDAMDQLTQVTIGLQAWSSAQLYEVMVDFWSNHLNVANHTDTVWNTRHAYDREVIRKYAMGSFTDLLLASAKHPAMLTYLNLAESTKAHVNENYGRELLELHTVGLIYSEDDVVNTASLLTGRTIDDYSHYLFDDYIHPTGPIKVLGFTHPNTDPTAGEAAGDALLRYLAEHPATAKHLAQKLCVRLVSDTPSAALVTAVTGAYLDNGTSIIAMLSVIFRSTEFWASRGAKVRRPTENLVATMRILGVAPKDYAGATQDLSWVTYDIGHRPLEWPAPNGYPDVAAAWRSAGTLMKVWNYHLGLTSGWWDELSKVTPASLWGTAKTSGAAIAALTVRLTGTTWTAAHLAALQTFLGEPASTPLAKSTLQWLAQPLIALILDSPHFALR